MGDQGSGEVGRSESVEANTMKILIASDCHIGYMEKDPERRNDSLTTFEEVLQHANQHKVDMILLGGDLFHADKPSRYFRYHCMRLLRQYSQRKEPSPIEYVEDPRSPDRTSWIPVISPRLTHQTPVFSIHGNHDNPSGAVHGILIQRQLSKFDFQLGNLCALDVLSEAGLINHFGRSTSHDFIAMTPVLIKKGNTKLALYGLGAITDKALHVLFDRGAVTMKEPPGGYGTWFTVFVIHQNRAYRGDKEFIPESFLAEKLNGRIDLVVWGHEHDCQLEPVWYRNKFRIIQPGSTIATSIVRGETEPKHVALLEISGRQMKCSKIPLVTVRPMYIKNVALKLAEHRLDPCAVDINSKVEEFCTSQINKMVTAITRDNHKYPKRPSLPLIKLRVDVSGGYPTLNKRRFAQRFVSKVANVRVHGHDEQNLIDFKDKESRSKAGRARASRVEPESLEKKKEFIEDAVKRTLEKAKGSKQLKVLSSDVLVDLLKEFVKNDNNAHPQLVDIVLGEAKGYLSNIKDEKLLEEEFKKFRQMRQDMQDADIEKEIKTAISLAKKSTQNRRRDDSPGYGFHLDLPMNTTGPSTSGGKRRPRPLGRPKGSGRGKGSKRAKLGSSSMSKQRLPAVSSDSSSEDSSGPERDSDMTPMSSEDEG